MQNIVFSVFHFQPHYYLQCNILILSSASSSNVSIRKSLKCFNETKILHFRVIYNSVCPSISSINHFWWFLFQNVYQSIFQSNYFPQCWENKTLDLVCARQACHHQAISSAPSSSYLRRLISLEAEYGTRIGAHVTYGGSIVRRKRVREAKRKGRN